MNARELLEIFTDAWAKAAPHSEAERTLEHIRDALRPYAEQEDREDEEEQALYDECRGS